MGSTTIARPTAFSAGLPTITRNESLSAPVFSGTTLSLEGGLQLRSNSEKLRDVLPGGKILGDSLEGTIGISYQPVTGDLQLLEKGLPVKGMARQSSRDETQHDEPGDSEEEEEEGQEEGEEEEGEEEGEEEKGEEEGEEEEGEEEGEEEEGEEDQEEEGKGEEEEEIEGGEEEEVQEEEEGELLEHSEEEENSEEEQGVVSDDCLSLPHSGGSHDGSHEDGPHSGGSHDGSHEDGPHSGGSHDGSHEDGPHSDGSHDDGPHSGGSHDESHDVGPHKDDGQSGEGQDTMAGEVSTPSAHSSWCGSNYGVCMPNCFVSIYLQYLWSFHFGHPSHGTYSLIPTPY